MSLDISSLQEKLRNHRYYVFEYSAVEKYLVVGMLDFDRNLIYLNSYLFGMDTRFLVSDRFFVKFSLSCLGTY